MITHCPVCGTELVTSDSGKSIMCPNIHCEGRGLARMVNMFSKMNIKGFAEAAFKSINSTHLKDLYNITEEEYVNLLGDVYGRRMIDELNKLRYEGIRDYIIMGALGFSNIAYKKWQVILQQINLGELMKLYLMSEKNPDMFYRRISAIPHIGTVTARTIATEWEFFEDDLVFILDNINLIESKNTNPSKGQIRFSGVRNKQLEEQLITAGFDAGDSSVTKNTDILLIPYNGYTSGKVSKAVANGTTKIIPIQDFIENTEKYIGINLNM